MGCRITDHAKEDPEWGIENADALCPSECHTEYGPCPHWYDDRERGEEVKEGGL